MRFVHPIRMVLIALLAFVLIGYAGGSIEAKAKAKTARTVAAKKAPTSVKKPGTRARARVIQRQAEEDEEGPQNGGQTAVEPMDKISSIVVEADTGLILAEHNADVQRPPASMIKMMLMLMVAEGIEQGRWSLETPLTAGKSADGVGGTGVDIKVGETFTLDKLMSAVAVASANNAAIVVAEGLWGTEETYVRCMNQRAQELGMTNSEFHSPHGLPPAAGKKVDMTTARDMALLARACTTHQNVMNWVGLREIEFKPGFKKNSTNKLMAAMAACDGLKTGFTNAAGFCMSATAKRDNVRIVTVVMGFTGSRARFEMAGRLLEQGFTQVKRACVVAKGAPLGDPVPVLNSEGKSVALTAGEDLWVTVRTEDMPRLQIRPECPLRLQAPLKNGAVVGQVNVLLSGKSLGRVPLTTSENVPEARWRYKIRKAATVLRKG